MNKMEFLLPKEKRKNRKHCRRSGAQCPSARACKVDAPSPKGGVHKTVLVPAANPAGTVLFKLSVM